MDKIWDKIEEAIHDFLSDVCGGIFINIFDDVNASTGKIAAEVGKTPSEWNIDIFTMIKNLSNNVIIPIAGLIITFVLCYELITAITEKNNMHDVDTFLFFKYIFKACIAVYLLSHTFEIVVAIFDVGHGLPDHPAARDTAEKAGGDIGKAKGVCEYKGGEIKDDVCIVNGTVVEVKKP